MRPLRAIPILVLACALIPSTGQASTDRSGTYLVPTAPSGGYVDVVADYGVGGYIFAANGEVPTRIKVEDATGNPTGITICQEDATGVACGLEQDWCGSGWFTIPDLGWSKNKSVAVFVHTADRHCPEFGISVDRAVATTGTITLRTA